jgi:hypothetical protein
VLFAPAEWVLAQVPEETVALSVRLRAVDGSPVVGEPVSLQRLPDEEPVLPECTTDTRGMCTWHVGRGLYQVLFSRPLDDVSALALAEGGLRGFGLTVGERAVSEGQITYHFTFHTDGRVYFDAAPEAATPAPIIPTPELLHGGIAPTSTPEATMTPEPAETEPDGNRADSNSTNSPAAEKGEPTGRGWRLLLLIALGTTAGGGLHLWSRRKNQATPVSKTAPDTAREDTDA